MRNSRFAPMCTVASTAILLAWIAVGLSQPVMAADPSSTSRLVHASVPVRFEPNRGQTAKDVHFVGKGAGYDVALKTGSMTITAEKRNVSERTVRQVPITMSLIGADTHPAISGFHELPATSNYLPTSDRRTWITGVPNYAGVLYHHVYANTDLVFRGDKSRLEYDFCVAPGGNPAAIAWRIGPESDVRLQEGALIIRRDGVELQFLKPIAYQEGAAERTPVSAAYQLQRDSRGTRVQFALGSYDRRRALVIDPVLVYSTQFSGIYVTEAMNADSAGNVYLASGYSSGVQVAKLAPDGSTVIYNTTIGTSSTYVWGVAVNSSGQVYVTGQAVSGLPTTAGAYQATVSGGWDAFLTVIDPSGASLVYSSYLGGSNSDVAEGVAVDSSGKALIAGWTTSTNFPNTNSSTLSGYTTAFVARFDPAQSGSASLVYSSALPSSYSSSEAVAVKPDAAGNAYAAVQGYLTTTAGAYKYDAVYPNSTGVYVVELNASGATQFVSYLGEGSASDLDVDNAGNAYVTGTVSSADFPATTGAYQTSFPNAFVAKLNAGGATLAYSTFLGGPSGDTWPTSIAVPSGCTSNCTPVVAGYTAATDFPVVNAIQNAAAGDYDAFLVSLTADGSNATFSTYLGGVYDDAYYYTGYHIPQVALDGSGNIYIAGDTDSSDFPFTTHGTGYSYVTKISPSAGAMLVPDQATVAFGTHTLGVASDPIVVNFRNYGTIAATIISGPVSDNPAFTATNSCGGSVPAGGACAVQVVYTANVAGSVSGTLTLGYNNGTASATATAALTGYGSDQAELHVTPGGDSYFGAVTVNTASTAYTYTVSNVGSKAATISSIYVADTANFKLTATNCPGVLDKGASCTFSLSFTPSTVGYLDTYYEVNANAYVSPSYYAYLYGTGSGVGVAGLTPWATSLSFPDQVVGTTSSIQYLEIQNTGTIPVTFGKASVTGDFKNYSSGCDENTVSPGSTCTIDIQFTPTTTGTRTGTLTISNSAGPDLSISLSGNGVTAAPGLVFTPQNLLFSDQVIGTASGTVNVTVTNTGNSSLTITRVYDSGGAFQLTSTGCVRTLAPLQSCSVGIKFAPTTAGAQTGTVYFVDSLAGSPQTITSAGTGVAATQSLIASPAAANFDDAVAASSTSTTAIYLYNQGNFNVTTSTPVPSSADWSVTYNNCGTVYAASNCEIDVRFQPQSPGLITGTLTIPNSTNASPLVVNLNGTGLAPVNSIVATPLSLGFADTVVGATTGTESVTFYNPGNAPVKVTGASVLGGVNAGEFVVTSDGCNNATIQPGSYCAVYLQFAPTGSAGTRSATLTITDSAPGSPHSASLNGSAVNLVAALIPSPAGAGFDDQVVGTTSTATVISLYNPGNSKVTISNTAVTGDFAVSTPCASINAHSYCNMYVTFSPTAAGARTGTVTLTDDASGSPQGISLYGNGLLASRTLAITPASLDFANVLASTNATQQVVYLLNTGTQSVTITPAPSVTSPYTVTGCNVTLNPGVSCAMNVSLNSATTGSFPGTLTITDNATGSPQTVSLAANVVATAPATSISPNGLSFDHRVVNTTSGAITATFSNKSGATITFTGISTTGDFAIASNNCSSGVASNGSCNVTVDFTPTATGLRTGTLVFSQAAGATSIALRGYGDPATSVVQLSATSLSFEDQVVSTTSAAQTIRVWNNGTTPLTVSAPSISMSPVGVPAAFAVSGNGCTSAVPAASSCTMSLTFTPSVSGAASGTLTLNASDPASPHTITLNGIGVSSVQTMQASATSIQFNDQVVGTTSAVQTVFFYNTGNTAVTGAASSISGGDFAIQYDGCNTTIAARSYCYINVNFTPTATGSRTATLSVNNNAPGAPQTVAISGNGITANKSYRISASALSFNDQPVGVQGNPEYVYFYNTGTTSITLSGATATGADFKLYDSCSSRVLAAGNSCYVAVTLLPTTTGALTGTLSIANDAPAGAATVSLSGNGIAATKLAHLSASALQFPDQAIGVTAPYQAIYLYNTGNVGVTVGTLSITGDFAIQYDYCSGYTVSPGSYCNFYVNFTPTASGPRTGSVNVPDNSTTSPHTVSLSGNGLTPSLRLNFSPGNLNFPPTPTGSTSRALEIDVSNIGNAPVQITSATLTGADFKISYNSCNNLTLQPGASSYYYTCYVDVQLQPTTTGTLSGSLTFTDSATGSPHTIPLTGTGIDPTGAVQVSQSSITFADQSTNVRSTAAVVYLSNLDATTATVSGVTVTGDFSFSGCDAGTTLYQYNNCAMYVYFTPTAAGPRTGSISIADNSASSPHVITLAGNGINPAPLVGLTPSSLNFGSQPLASTTNYQSISLMNTGTAPLQVTGMVSSSTDFPLSTSCVTTIAAGSSCTFYVAFNPQAAGTRSGSVQITDNASGSPHVLPLTGTGVGSVVQLNPTTLNFGTQVVGAVSNPQTITVTNAGNVTLNIASIVAAGDFSQTNNCPAALGGGGSCTISVTFTPSVQGVRTGGVTITDDGAGSPQAVVVQGNGAQPQADLALTAAANPAGIQPGGSTTFTFTVINNGTATATGLTFTSSLPSNATVTSINAPGGTCTYDTSITCTLNDLAASSSTTIAVAATNTVAGNMTMNASVATTQTEPYLANNSVSVTADAGIADLSLGVSKAASGTGFVFSVTNNGPNSATNVVLTCAYNRYGFSGANSTQGSCSAGAGSVTCAIGGMVSGAVVQVTQLVQPPSQGWAGISCHAGATQFDTNPVNNSAQISPDGVNNTMAGTNIGVQLIDRVTGQIARVVFPSVTASGVTTLTGVAGAVAPAGFRNGAQAWAYDLATTASTVGLPTVTFTLPAGQFRHPAQVRLFHLENGTWVDRTVAQDTASATVAAVSPSLSPFALFEPLDHAPIANPGADRFAAATSTSGVKVTLNAGASTDADGDALTYRWTGPFPEGNGMVTGAQPSVTLPFGASRITLVVNDGEADSVPAAVSYTVTDFGVAPVAASIDVVRGSSATIPVQVRAVGGAYDQAVTLSCSGLPAGLACSFSPAIVQPGANGASSNLTISSTSSAALHRRTSNWAFAVMLFGFVGVLGDKRRRTWMLLAIIALALVIAMQVGCGGGSVNGFSNQPAPGATTTVTVTVKGTSAGLTHSSNVTVTLH